MKKFLSFALTLLAAGPVGAFDHAVLDALLRRHVNEEGLVDYTALKGEHADQLAAYLKHLETANTAAWPPRERLAFWINAYNAHMIQRVLENPGLKQVSQNFALFDQPFRVAGASLTLNDIEHRILRGKTNAKNGLGPIPGVTLKKLDPRIHFALVCAARDCPRLRRFAYTAFNVETTLQQNAVYFADQPKHVSIRNGRLRLSSLLKWYAEDFAAQGGVALTLTRLLDLGQRPDRAEIKEHLKGKKFDQAFYDYDCTLNDIGLAP